MERIGNLRLWLKVPLDGLRNIRSIFACKFGKVDNYASNGDEQGYGC